MTPKEKRMAILAHCNTHLFCNDCMLLTFDKDHVPKCRYDSEERTEECYEILFGKGSEQT